MPINTPQTEHEHKTVEIDSIPSELKVLPRWVLWKKQDKEGGDITKVPIDAKTGKNAAVNNSST